MSVDLSDQLAALAPRLSGLSSAAVSDALDRLGLQGQVPGIARRSGEGTVVGPAFTVRYEPVGIDGGTVGDYIDDVPTGSVVVLANTGRVDVTVWGGLLSQIAARRGIVGTVIDGCCRDIARAEQVGYSLFSKAVWMRTGKDRVRAEAVQTPVSICGVRVRPDDLVMCDADGVIVIPVEHAIAVTELAESIEAIERSIADAIARGDRLDDARAKSGYHVLQRRAPAASVGEHDDGH